MSDKEEKFGLSCVEKGTLVEKDRNDKFPSDKLSESACKELIHMAVAAMRNAYVPYSGFKVGAALLTADNVVYTGCNIENASYTPTNCAERTAFFKAVSEGVREFRAIAIVGGADGEVKEFCPPCGVCRQVMCEFCDPDRFAIILARSDSDYEVYSLREIMPLGFTKENLK